jgi:hypothetical protein
MAVIQLTAGGFSLIPEGIHVFQIVGVNEDNYKDFGDLIFTLKTKDGKTHLERFRLLGSDGLPNDGAMRAFSYFAHTAMNDFDIPEIDTSALVGRYIKAEVVHRETDSRKNPGEKVKVANLGKKWPADGFDSVVPLPAPAPAPAPARTYTSDELDAILG